MLVYSESHARSKEKRDYVAIFDDQISKKKVVINQPTDDQYESRKKSFKLSQKLSTFFTDVFLPEGFPDSVSDDYVNYQIWDTLQAFANSISGSLSTQVFKLNNKKHF